jgi:hypothetical protein
VKALVLFALATSFGCGARSGAPPQTPTAAETPADAGLPVPPASKKRGVIVPSDMGMGAGTSGPTSNSGTAPAVSPPVGGTPGLGN